MTEVCNNSHEGDCQESTLNLKIISNTIAWAITDINAEFEIAFDLLVKKFIKANPAIEPAKAEAFRKAGFALANERRKVNVKMLTEFLQSIELTDENGGGRGEGVKK